MTLPPESGVRSSIWMPAGLLDRRPVSEEGSCRYFAADAIAEPAQRPGENDDAENARKWVIFIANVLWISRREEGVGSRCPARCEALELG
jgi:hypothetical protein